MLFSSHNASSQFSKSKSIWLPIGLCAIFIIYKYILQVSPSIMLNTLMQEFHMDGVSSGHLSASFLYALMLTQLFVGYWLDRYRPLYSIIVATLLCSIGAIGFASSQAIHMAILSRVVMGIGGAFAAASYFKMTSILVPPKYFAFVSGLLATAVTLGMVIGQLLLTFLVQYSHWRSILIGYGIFGALLSIAFASLLKREREKDKSSLKDDDQHLITLKDIKAILKNPQNWLLTVYHGLAFAPVGAFAGLWGISFLKQAISVNYSAIPLLSTCVFIGFGLGSPMLGFLADHYISKKKLMLANASLALCIMSLILYYPYLSCMTMGILLFFLGFSSSALMLGFVLGRSINPARASATAVTFLNTGGVAITAITEPLIGRLLDWQWSGTLKEGIHYFSLQNYQIALSILPIYLILALVLLYFIQKDD